MSTIEWKANPNSGVAHGYIRGAASGGGSICGRATLDPDAASATTACSWCDKAAKQIEADEKASREIKQFTIGRRMVHVGDFVQIKATPGRRDGFVGRVKSVRVEDGELVEVTVTGAKSGRAPAWRTIVPCRVVPLSTKRQKHLQDGLLR